MAIRVTVAQFRRIWHFFATLSYKYIAPLGL
jgi:hypothetical protein